MDITTKSEDGGFVGDSAPATAHFFVDYKKDGDRPKSSDNLPKMEGTSYQPSDQPIRKERCEDWNNPIDESPTKIKVINNPFGENVDVCTRMENDVIYRYMAIQEDRPNSYINKWQNENRYFEIPVQKGSVVALPEKCGLSSIPPYLAKNCSVKEFK